MYLFEYVSKNYPQIETYYFVNSLELKQKLEKDNLRSVVIGSKEAKKLAKRAGVSFYTHGIDDFGMNVYNYDSYVVALWHGVGFKKIYYSDTTFRDNLVKKIYRNLFSYVHRDLTVTTSDYCFDCFAKDFRLKKSSKYVVIGQPRNDLLLENNDHLKEDKKIILYAPTYRRFEKDDANLQSVIDLFSAPELQEKLSKLGYVLYVKLHPLTTGIQINESDFIKNVCKEEAQSLLKRASVLITDYSSIACDFAITGRKIIFYAPDYDEYVKSEPMFEESDYLYKGKLTCKTPDEVIDKILSEDYSLTNELNSIFNSSLEGNYRKRIVEYLFKKLKI